VDRQPHGENHRSRVMKHVRLSVRRSRSVEEGTLNHGWARDIFGELTVDALRDYLC
jgi:hypothetical protein